MVDLSIYMLIYQRVFCWGRFNPGGNVGRINCLGHVFFRTCLCTVAVSLICWWAFSSVGLFFEQLPIGSRHDRACVEPLSKWSPEMLLHSDVQDQQLCRPMHIPQDIPWYYRKCSAIAVTSSTTRSSAFFFSTENHRDICRNGLQNFKKIWVQLSAGSFRPDRCYFPICEPRCWNIDQHLPEKSPIVLDKHTIHGTYGYYWDWFGFPRFYNVYICPRI